MADGIFPTENDIKVAREGVMKQYRSLSITEFLDNTIMVIASERAISRALSNETHKELNNS